MPHAAPAQLLDAFPLVRSHSVEEASDRIGRAFSPHRLALCGRSGRLNVAHNQVWLRDVSLNVLHYGADVLIDPGERGDFYMVQLPLAGKAQLACGGVEVSVDPGVLSVLQPQTLSRMLWTSDCTMLLVQVPRRLVLERAAAWGLPKVPTFAFAQSRQTPEVAAWWQMALDLTTNLDRFGAQWLRYPAAHAAMEELLLSAFASFLSDGGATPAAPPRRGDARCLRRAKEFIHAHGDRALSSAEIARHACVSPRTLEAVFKRQGEIAPLAYARRWRLQQVHDALRQAAREGRSANVTETALSHGFVHMGRFAAQYRAQFGCSPSQSLRPH